MASPTFNAASDYFEMETDTSDAVKVISSNENAAMESQSGPNTFGDPCKVDSYRETKSPSAEYVVVDEITQAAFELGTVHEVSGFTGPVVRGGMTVSTANGQPPTITVDGKMVQAGATQLRSYPLPAMTILPRHRAQDICGLMSIKIGAADADPMEDYGLESMQAQFPIEITLAQPKGVTVNYDLHGDMATFAYTMHWYAATEPTIALSSAATALGATMSVPKSKACPEGGYTQYTWTVALPLVGSEVSASQNNASQNNG